MDTDEGREKKILGKRYRSQRELKEDFQWFLHLNLVWLTGWGREGYAHHLPSLLGNITAASSKIGNEQWSQFEKLIFPWGVQIGSTC